MVRTGTRSSSRRAVASSSSMEPPRPRGAALIIALQRSRTAAATCAGLRRGPTVPAGVVPDRPVTRAHQERDLFVPQRVVEHSAMQQYDRTAIAFHVVEQLSAVHLRGTGRHRYTSPC